MTYSIAIRTLGTNPEILKKELQSIERQALKPEKVVIYIAQGYSKPNFVVGKEEYVYVKKGMVAQRALRYDEISSDYILMLDDDVELAEDSAERMLAAMRSGGVICVAADTFKNQEMTIIQKIKAVISTGAMPRKDDGWAFKQRMDGSFSYNSNPKKNFCLTQTFAGPCWMIKKSVLKDIRLQDELWLDDLGFAYGDDAVESYKIFRNGFKLGVLYDSGVINLDGKSVSSKYHSNMKKFYTRSFGMFIIWHRMLYSNSTKKVFVAIALVLKLSWQLILHVVMAIVMLKMEVVSNFIDGLFDAIKFVKSDRYKSLPPYILK